VYFYTGAWTFWNVWQMDKQRGLGIQNVAAQFGFGKPTGVELSEATGRIPDPAWKTAFAKANYKTAEAVRQNSIWYPADNIHAAVGQGDDFVTPLQLANAYATFANGFSTHVGTVWTPHLDQTVIDPMTKRVVQNYTPKARGTVNFGDAYPAMAAGFRGVVNDPKGTAYDAFRGLIFPAVSGKTGTADVTGKGATSLFASYFPSDNPDYAVVALVEQGGHGAQIAAPIVRQIVENIYSLPTTPIPTLQTGKD